MATIARQMAQWVANLTYDQIGEKTIHEVKRRVIDSFGCALGAYHQMPCKIARACAESVNAVHAGTVWGTTHYSAANKAAFANGTMVRYLDYNDTYLSLEPAHPSDNLPAAFAVAETAGKTGKDIILAAVIGYEIQCRLCDAASLRIHGWDHVTYGAISTALLSGKLWGHNEDQLEHAVGLAGVCNIATRQTRTGQLSMWKACAFANAARNGVFAANLARRGMTGPHEIFEGPKGIFNQLTGPFSIKLGTTDDFMIDKAHIKYWPAEYHAQSAIDATLQLRPEIDPNQGIRTIQIDSFEAAVSTIGSEPEKWRPTSRETADHSMPYCVAVALLDGNVTLNSFDEKRLTDPQILGLLDKITIKENPELNPAYPEGIPNHIKITLESGQTLEKRVDFPRGHYRNPMTDEEVVAKFRRLAKGVVPDQTADKMLELSWKLDELDDVRPLVQQKVPS